MCVITVFRMNGVCKTVAPTMQKTFPGIKMFKKPLHVPSQ